MRYELNEIEARIERYPSTISFLNLLNALIAEEKDTSDRGRRYWSMISVFWASSIINIFSFLASFNIDGLLADL